MKSYLLALFIIFLLLVKIGNAQKIEKYLSSIEPLKYEKLYLHVDREFYFLGDTVWFSAYQLDGNTHKVKAGKSNVYIELINHKGKISCKELFTLNEGTTGGYLSLKDSNIIEGNYLLRAYTDYQKNFGDDNYFEKRIKISQINNSIELSEKEEERKKYRKIDIDLQLLPEGGFLLAGMVNRVAIKAINQAGMGVDVKGKLVDSDGNYVLTFGSVYSGMGVFYFVPKEGETYVAKVDGFSDEKVILNDIRTSATKLTKVNNSEDYLTVRVLSNKEEEKEPFHLVCLNRGDANFHVRVETNQINSLIKISTKDIDEGINRLVLLDNDFTPISERLIFSSNFALVDLNLSLNNYNLSTREQIQLDIESSERKALNKFAKLSIAVVDENALNSKGQTQNIHSYLLLDSELNGFVESPYDYFNDGEQIRSKSKLDLLMLTNGWSNYVWNELGESNFTQIYENQNGIVVSGSLKKNIGKKIEKLSNVLLGAFTDEETFFFNQENSSRLCLGV